MRDSMLAVEHALDHCQSNHAVKLVALCDERNRERGKPASCQPLTEIFSGFFCIIELLIAIGTQQFFPGGLRVHDQAAKARERSCPIFASSSMRSPANVTFCESRVSASTRAKMVKPP